MEQQHRQGDHHAGSVRLTRGRQWLAGHRLLVDTVGAAGLTLLLAMFYGPGSAEAALLLLQVAPLAWRRVAPFPAALAVAAGCLLQLAVTDTPLPSNAAVLVVVYGTSCYARQRWQAWTVLGLGWLGALLAGLDWSGGFTTGPGSPWHQVGGMTRLLYAAPVVAALAVAVAAAWVLGDAVRRRHALVAGLRAQNAALARDQAQRARLAAQDERAAIAREMHDIVAHSLAVVVVQADGAAYAARAAIQRHEQAGESGPGGGGVMADLGAAAGTLETVAGTARAALADTRRLVGVLRDADAGAEYATGHGTADLAELVAGVEEAGVPVRLAVRGRTDDLPPEVDQAAYRVAQESLTNVLKHAGPDASAEVDLLRSPAVLLVRVSDDGLGLTGHDGEGNGIVGMTERVHVLGGTLHAGPRHGGGFEVVATLPVAPAGEPAAPVPQRPAHSVVGEHRG
ncbi:sensor histidine kinase [Ornithinicoccus halotolerans]|uniref:sensor histidine kinase n=1 Tax=Ornithinicoccus halotolerans TaxID=1748220 RepID=UPI001296032C|nr:histidine kinase [Ornithinicoccus halotolerans]